MGYAENGSNYSHGVAYGYDSCNNLSTLTECTNGVTSTTSYTCDALGRVSQQRTRSGGSVILLEGFLYTRVSNYIGFVMTTPGGTAGIEGSVGLLFAVTNAPHVRDLTG